MKHCQVGQMVRKRSRTIPHKCAQCGAAFFSDSRRSRCCSRECARLKAIKTNSTPEKFWSFVDKGAACWTWMGGNISSAGYGFLRWNGKRAAAHRVAYEIANGAAPGTLSVCHACDNPICVNPSHLFLGTHKDNMRDMARKERAPNNKLTAADVSEIRRLRAAGTKTKALAQRFGVTRGAICFIIAGKAWRHVP